MQLFEPCRADRHWRNIQSRAYTALENAAFTVVSVMLEVCKYIIVFLVRDWRTKKSNVRVDAEARAREVIKEDYQKLGPTK